MKYLQRIDLYFPWSSKLLNVVQLNQSQQKKQLLNSSFESARSQFSQQLKVNSKVGKTSKYQLSKKENFQMKAEKEPEQLVTITGFFSFDINTVLSMLMVRIEKNINQDCLLIQYQILQTKIIRIVWETERKIEKKNRGKSADSRNKQCKHY